jgi:hypothetical protein
MLLVVLLVYLRYVLFSSVGSACQASLGTAPFQEILDSQIFSFWISVDVDVVLGLIKGHSKVI